jgi:hypothetical protein
MVYLIHLDEPIAHMRHYVGTSSRDSVPRDSPFGVGRRGASWLEKRTAAAGIAWRVARTWPEEGKDFEVRLRNYAPSLAQFCPACSGEAAYRRAANTRGPRPPWPADAPHIVAYVRKSERDAFCLRCPLPDCVGMGNAKCPINVELRRRRSAYYAARKSSRALES